MTFSQRAAARAVATSPSTIRRAIASGALPASRFGARRIAILRSDLENWIRQHAFRPGPDAGSRREVPRREHCCGDACDHDKTT